MHIMVTKIIILLTGLLLNLSVMANDHFESAFADAQQTALEMQSQIDNLMSETDPKDFLPDFNPNSPLEDYFTGVDQANLDLNTEAQAQFDQHEGAQAVKESFNQRPVFTIDENDPALLWAEQILEDAQNITGGLNPCQTPPLLCESTYSYHTCEVGNTLDPLTCTQTLNVIPGQVQQDTQTLTMAVSATRTIWLNMPAQVITFWVDLASGKLLYTSGGNELLGSRVSVSPTYQADSCDTLSTSANASPSIGFKLTKAPTCNNPIMKFQVTVPGMSISTSTTVTVKLQIASTSPPQDTWQDNCAVLAVQPDCRLTEAARCIEGPQTRLIDGVPITRDCWTRQLTYACGEAIDTCGALREQGCEQIGASCQQGTTESCGITTQTWQCAQTQCTPDENATCGSEIFCLDGDCLETDPTANDEFEIVASALSTLGTGISELDVDARIFSGKAMACSETPIGFKNCCADRGWGLDLGLASCKSEEQQLGAAKEKGLAVFVGRFCAERLLDVCIRYKRGHCVFNNTQAFLVQSQARTQQLGLDFGSGEFPACTGFTPEQLARIDFEKIDFSPLFAELQDQIKLPDVSELIDNIEVTPS